MAVETKDDGRYRCTLTNGTADVSAYFRLKVEVCDSMYHPPRVMKAPQNTSARVGDSITFLCEGFFGCGDPMFKNVRFFSKITNIKKGKLEFFHLGHHDNYIYKMYNTTNMDVIGANLTIRRVMIQNFSQIYICDLGTVRRSAVILPLDVTVKITVVEIVLIACVSTAAMIMMLIIAISCWLHFPRILFWCNTKFNTCSRKGEFLYDTAVVCIEQDIPVVRGRLLQMLREQLGYHVYFGPDDLSGGHGETTGQTDLFPKTYCAIMFISKESLEENAFKFICHCATCLVGGPYLILIKRGDIPKSAWSHVPRNLERRLKVILSLTLPEESNGEDVQRFLSSIRSKLPKPQTKTRTTSDRQSLSSFEVTLLSDTDD
ncbi:uncharacterized protein LOC121370917 isoform X2 [Gigantopelta aegis]|nr:uncharacterized protein LOC121370917 isoform X2 [Gigantopelta aegis]